MAISKISARTAMNVFMAHLLMTKTWCDERPLSSTTEIRKKSGCRPPNTFQHALGQHALGGASFHLLLLHGGDASCNVRRLFIRSPRRRGRAALWRFLR